MDPRAVDVKAEAARMAGEGAGAGDAAAVPLAIAVRRMRKTYDGTVALDDVSIDVGAGEFLTLLGPSGSGKTTLLNIIAGFVRPDRGNLLFGDADVTLTPVNQRGLGMVFQSYALFPHMTVGENVAFPLKVRKFPREAIEERVRTVLRLVKLEAMIARNVRTLSGGQRQRVALARAVVFSPRIVLMDEPLSALDKSLREEMQVEIRHLHRRINATTIYVTHDQREAMTIGDRVAVMNEGRIIQHGPPTEIYRNPRTAFVARFIGETTLLPATRGDGGRLRLGDGTLIRTGMPAPADGPVFIALRAEQILMPEECGPEANRLSVTLRDVIFQGDSLLMIGEMQGGQSLAIRRHLRDGLRGRLPAAGETLRIGIDPDNAIAVSE